MIQTPIILPEARSEDAQEMLSKKPPVFIRWGASIFAFAFLMMLLVCYLIEYPDIVLVNFRLTSAQAPMPVYAKSTGKLVQLFAKEGQYVKKGIVLAFLESTASHQNVLSLESNLNALEAALQNNEVSKILAFKTQNYENLGELQTNYQTFNTTYLQ